MVPAAFHFLQLSSTSSPLFFCKHFALFYKKSSNMFTLSHTSSFSLFFLWYEFCCTTTIRAFRGSVYCSSLNPHLPTVSPPPTGLGQRGFNLEVALTYEKDPIFERIYTKFFSGKFKILSKKFLQHPSRDFSKTRMHSGMVQGLVNKN